MKKLIVAILILTFLIPAQAVFAQLRISDIANQGLGNLQAAAFVVMDMQTGDILWQKGMRDSWIPASLTKVLSVMVVLDLKPDLNKPCKITKSHEVGGARLQSRLGGVYKLQDLIQAALVASANNATVAMAECVSNKTEFVQALNKKAQDLGAVNSSFVEPSGIDPKNVSTPEDLAKIFRAGFSTPYIQKISQNATVKFSSLSKPKKTHTLVNTNKLLKDSLIQVISGKTGYLDESKYNFTIAVKLKEKNYLLVVLGAPTQAKVFEDTRLLINLLKIL